MGLGIIRITKELIEDSPTEMANVFAALGISTVACSYDARLEVVTYKVRGDCLPESLPDNTTPEFFIQFREGAAPTLERIAEQKKGI